MPSHCPRRGQMRISSRGTHYRTYIDLQKLKRPCSWRWIYHHSTHSIWPRPVRYTRSKITGPKPNEHIGRLRTTRLSLLRRAEQMSSAVQDAALTKFMSSLAESTRRKGNDNHVWKPI